MDARPAVMWQWLDRKAISQGAPQYARKQGGDCNSHRTNARMRRSERTERTDWAAPRSQKRPNDQTSEVKPGRGSHDQPRVRTPREGQGRTGKKSNRTQTMERTGRPNPHGILKSFLEGRRHRIRQEHRQIQRRKKSQLSDRDSAEATEHNRNGMRHIRLGERKTITRR